MNPVSRCAAPVDEYGKHYKAGEFLPFYVPRPFMPQIDEQYTVQMIVDAAQQSLPRMEVVDPGSLRAHQRIDHGRAKGMSDDVRAKPIIVSKDGYVVDGNHRWWAHVHSGSKAIAVIRLQMEFEHAVDWLNGLQYVYRIQMGTPIRN